MYVIQSLLFLKRNKRLNTKRLDYVRHATLELVSEEIYLKNIQGDVAELGVYHGDFAREINVAFPDRKLYLFDTFEGFDKKDVTTELKKRLFDRGTGFFRHFC